ncbi:SUKH-4 family immunity protein [Streptomyces syringium]|uniref:SUKH-4 family immunity protein n=1 Tax=Streptomyces syringium TaxID=76729 RepID=UPI0036E9E1A7
MAAWIWPDGDGARFVTEIGIPHSNGLFRILEELADRDLASSETAFTKGLGTEPVDTPHGRLQPLGMLFQAVVFVSLGDGTIWVSGPDSEIEYELIHGDASSLGCLVYKFEVERPGRTSARTPTTGPTWRRSSVRGWRPGTRCCS